MRHVWAKLCVVIFLITACVTPATAQSSNDANTIPTSANVMVDGKPLFSVRGTQAFPAKERAKSISKNIIDFAKSADDGEVVVNIEETPLGRRISLDDTNVAFFLEEDAKLDLVSLDILALVNGNVIKEAVVEYRLARTNDARLESLSRMAGWTVLFSAAFYILILLRRKVPDVIRKITEKRLSKIQAATSRIIRGRAVSEFVSVIIRLFFLGLILLASYYYVSFVLFAFVETRPFATLLITYVSDPIFELGFSIVGYTPNLVTLLVIYIVMRYLLNLLRNVFDNIEAGTLSFDGFEAHWIWPTYNILRVLMVVFALVLAYPYIPGSSSQAFQAISILVGLMVSMGSNSVVSNALAGLFVLYRRSANIGDRIKVGGHTGDVVAIKLMETYIKSLKNELISVPNSQFLGSEVINYSTKIDGRGLLVHTTVGIGYEESQEKVEALLLEAASRTHYIKKSPPPFVLRTLLGDFAVNYQINGFTTRGEYMQKIISELHSHILDVFHENGVQIMSPHYEADPETLKIPEVPPKETEDKDP
ncbi:MAG: mechanosensitive ion channel domain-containing protein [Pseudoruegeria sp.]